ncbi:MAG TPA: hypothetical protein K8V00_01655 [Ligilactobacillus acidipiscis]|uniref:Uncharacterized protein n=1 Tax=Ligilactobacillus acidipiscis TaxID=89059 RepID=A0A921F6M3_9LACO|nr:hypothetical protein [Ligilactobacillus acidipiscis]
MTSIVLNKERIFRKVKENTKKVDNVEYTYDPKFDILRIKFKDFGNCGATDYNDHINFVNAKKGVAYVEIYDFKKNYNFKEYKKAIPNDTNALRTIEKIHHKI